MELVSRPLGIRGWGAVSALGVGIPAAVEAMREGRRGIRTVTRSPHLVPIDGVMPVAGEAPLDVPIDTRLHTMVGLAVDEALAMAGPASGPVGVFVGTTGGFFVEAEVDLHHRRKLDPRALPGFWQRGPGEVAEWIAARIGADGPVLTWSMACTSSAAAVAAAAAHLRAGTCARAVVVGFDSLSSFTVYGFRSLLLVDPAPCRPFDRTRAGLQLGEGCGVVVIDAGDGPFQLLGADNCIDTTNLTASTTDGSTVERVIRGAIERSGLTPNDIVSVKAHGTGTQDNDLAEGRGLVRVFGTPPPFASLKGALGHTLGAAGTIELALWLGALQAGFLPASVGFADVDEDIGASPLTTSIPAPRGAHLFDAFGFGGSCVAFVVRDA